MINQNRTLSSKELQLAVRRAANIRRDLGRAVGLYSHGDRSEIVLRTIAIGATDYEAVGARIPVPFGTDPDQWHRVVQKLTRAFTENRRCASSDPVVTSDTPAAA